MSIQVTEYSIKVIGVNVYVHITGLTRAMFDTIIHERLSGNRVFILYDRWYPSNNAHPCVQ